MAVMATRYDFASTDSDSALATAIAISPNDRFMASDCLNFVIRAGCSAMSSRQSTARAAHIEWRDTITNGLLSR